MVQYPFYSINVRYSFPLYIIINTSNPFWCQIAFVTMNSFRLLQRFFSLSETSIVLLVFSRNHTSVLCHYSLVLGQVMNTWYIVSGDASQNGHLSHIKFIACNLWFVTILLCNDLNWIFLTWEPSNILDSILNDFSRYELVYPHSLWLTTYFEPPLIWMHCNFVKY